jgi:uncharacterized protein (TIGR00299 family) protein
MNTLYLDIFSGISGDMFLGAMIDLGVDAPALEHELAKLKLDGCHLHVRRAVKANIEGVKFDVHLTHDHQHEHSHSHEHSHGDVAHAHGHAHHHSPPHGHDHPQEHEHLHAHGGGDHPDHLAGQTHGPHGGPLVATAGGRIELSVFETRVPPRFRLYCFDAHGHAAKLPADKDVTLETVRPGRKRQVFKFKRRSGFLEATTELPEPHEFTAILKLKRGSRAEKREVQFVEGRDHHHGHDHHPGPVHAHGRNFANIRQLIQQSRLSRWVKEKAIAVFHRIAVAEGRIHGHPPAEVHFHEVGAVDSIVDIVGACIALEMLGKPRVVAAPVVEGTGWVNCAHGRFPVPTMATLAILGARGIPLTQCEEPHELVTPTGAALLAEFAEEFGPMRGLVAGRIGYGLGTRDNHTRPNVLRAVLGEAVSTLNSQPSTLDWETDTIAVLETNLDDIHAEILGHFVETALAAGALDVFHTPIQMKKNRPGVLLTVLCAESDADKFSELMLRETSAFGVRRARTERRKLRRETKLVATPFGKVAIKLGKLNDRVLHATPEYESCRQLAESKSVPLKQVYAAAVKAAQS